MGFLSLNGYRPALYVYTYLYMYMYMYMYMYICMYICIYIYVDIYVYVYNIYIYIYKVGPYGGVPPKFEIAFENISNVFRSERA